MALEPSILNSTKKVLGLPENYDAYDTDVIIHINSALSNLCQIGLGPEAGFAIEDDSAEWSDFITEDDPRLNSARSYIYLFVKRMFDPPTTGYLSTAMDKQILEMEWRLNVTREEGITSE